MIRNVLMFCLLALAACVNYRDSSTEEEGHPQNYYDSIGNANFQSVMRAADTRVVDGYYCIVGIYGDQSDIDSFVAFSKRHLKNDSIHFILQRDGENDYLHRFSVAELSDSNMNLLDFHDYDSLHLTSKVAAAILRVDSGKLRWTMAASDGLGGDLFADVLDGGIHH